MGPFFEKGILEFVVKILDKYIDIVPKNSFQKLKELLNIYFSKTLITNITTIV